MIAPASVAIVAGAALYVWALAAFLHTPGLRAIQRWLRSGWRRPLVSCPYCAGFWLAVAFTLALHAWLGALDWIVTPLCALASAALVGVVGSNWTPGIDDDERV